MLEYVFNKVAGLQLFCEYCEIFKNSFFHKIPPVAASEKSINFQENISGGGAINLSFYQIRLKYVNILLTVVDISHFYVDLSNIRTV